MVLDCTTGLCVMTDYASWWSTLTSGNIMNAVLLTYTTTMDIYFYYLLLFLAMIMIYIKTGNFGTTVIMGIMILGAFLPFAHTFSHANYATVSGIIYAMIVLSVTGMLYKLFKG